MKWKEIDPFNKGKLIKMYIKAGFRSLDAMEKHWNDVTSKPASEEYIEESEPLELPDFKNQTYDADEGWREIMRNTRKHANGGQLFQNGSEGKKRKTTFEEAKRELQYRVQEANEKAGSRITPLAGQHMTAVTYNKDYNEYMPLINLPEIVIDGGTRNHKWDAYHDAHAKNVANAQQAVKEWNDRDQTVLNTMLGIGMAPLIASNPVSFGLGMLGGEGLNAAVRNSTDHNDFGDAMSHAIHGNSNYAGLYNWLNPGYLLGGKGARLDNKLYGKTNLPEASTPSNGFGEPVGSGFNDARLRQIESEYTAELAKSEAERDLEKLQRLRDEHFKTMFPESTFINDDGSITPLYRNADKLYPTMHNPEEQGTFFTTDKNYADGFDYGLTSQYYANVKNPFESPIPLDASLADYEFSLGPLMDQTKTDAVIGHDIMFTDNFDRGHFSNGEEVIIPHPRQVKLADAITYDDAGNPISLSLRDDFGNFDTRYGKEPSGGIGIFSRLFQKGKAIGEKHPNEDFTDFDIMVQRMEAPAKYEGENPFIDGKMTGFRKWALENGAKPEKIQEVENELRGNGDWKKLKEYLLKEDELYLSANKSTIFVNPSETSVTKNDFNSVFPHEVEHRIFRHLFNQYDVRKNIVTLVGEAFDKTKYVDKWVKSETKTGIKKETKTEEEGAYFSKDMHEELLTRFTQIKNALGIEEQRALTEEELRAAYELFKEGKIPNNNMKEFFESIKDWKKAAELSKYALMLTGIYLYNE